MSSQNKKYQLFFSKKEIECYYCEGNEIKCFFVIKIFFLAITKRKFYKKKQIKTSHWYEQNTFTKNLTIFWEKIAKKKLIKNKFYLYGACSLYEITIAILLIIINYYIFAKWHLSMPITTNFIADYEAIIWATPQISSHNQQKKVKIKNYVKTKYIPSFLLSFCPERKKKKYSNFPRFFKNKVT